MCHNKVCINHDITNIVINERIVCYIRENLNAFDLVKFYNQHCNAAVCLINIHINWLIKQTVR